MGKLTKSLLVLTIWIALLVGEVKCIYKAVTCNWEPVGKAEVFYFASSCIPVVGSVAGYINIEDK